MPEEDQSITWKSSMFSFSKGVLAWVLRACINEPQVSPTFTKEEANQFYSAKYSTPNWN